MNSFFLPKKRLLMTDSCSVVLVIYDFFFVSCLELLSDARRSKVVVAKLLLGVNYCEESEEKSNPSLYFNPSSSRSRNYKLNSPMSFWSPRIILLPAQGEIRVMVMSRQTLLLP